MNAMQSGNNPSDRSDEMMAGSTSFMSDSSGNQSVEIQGAPAPSNDSSNDPGGDQSAGNAAGGTGLQNSGSGPQQIGPPGGVGETSPGSGDDIGTGGIHTGAPGGIVGDAGLQLAGSDGLLQPAFDTVNSVVQDTTALLGTVGNETGLAPVVDDATGLLNTVGLGQIGATPSADGHSNLLTDVLNAPGQILDGNLAGAVDHIGSDVSDIANSLLGPNGLVGGLLGGDGLGSVLGGGLLGGENAGGAGGESGGLVGGVLGGDGLGNVLGNVLGEPTGSGAGGESGGLLGGLLGNQGGLLSSGTDSGPVSGLLGSLGSDLQNIPLLTVNGGNNANDGGLLGGILGNPNSSSTGHLVDADIGPQQSNGLALDLLSQPTSGPHNTIAVNAVDVPSSGPQLADLGLLTGGSDALHLPLLGGNAGSSGNDGLHLPLLGGLGSGTSSGGLLGDIASNNNTNVPVTATADLGATHDLVSAPVTADHGLLNLHGTHIV